MDTSNSTQPGNKAAGNPADYYPSPLLSLLLLPFILFTLSSSYLDKSQNQQAQPEEGGTFSNEIRFQQFLSDFPSVLNASGKEVLIVVPTSGCPKGIEWAIEFYQKNENLLHDQVKNMIVSENPFIYAQSPLPELLRPDYQGKLSQLRNSGFYPTAPQIAFMEAGTCKKFVSINCRPDDELAAAIQNYLKISSIHPVSMLAECPSY